MAPFRIVEILYPGLTQLDFTGPHTVFTRLPHTEVFVASRDGGEVTSDGDLTFAHIRRLADIDRCDLICIPGGAAATEAANDVALIAEVRRLAASARYLTSVCTGSLVLGAAGLLRERRAACHWAWRHLLPLFGAIPDEARVVRDGNIITGGGVTAGIDFALTVAAEIAGDAMAQAIQLGIEYAPAPPFAAGRPELAPATVLALVQARMDAVMPRRAAEAKAAAIAMD
jgi:putative intracellular protease/amidase